MPSDLHSCIDFAAFGQDALAVVFPFYAFWQSTRSMQQPCRLAYFLGPSALYCLQMLRLSRYVCSTSIPVTCLQSRSVGGYCLSRRISKANIPICSIGYFWIKHRGFRRRGMEKVPKDRRTSIFRGMHWAPFIAYI